MKIPEFKYDPIKITMKKKVDMENLGPDDDDIFLRIIASVATGFTIIMACIYVIARLGQVYNF